MTHITINGQPHRLMPDCNDAQALFFPVQHLALQLLPGQFVKGTWRLPNKQGADGAPITDVAVARFEAVTVDGRRYIVGPQGIDNRFPPGAAPEQRAYPLE